MSRYYSEIVQVIDGETYTAEVRQNAPLEGDIPCYQKRFLCDICAKVIKEEEAITEHGGILCSDCVNEVEVE